MSDHRTGEAEPAPALRPLELLRKSAIVYGGMSLVGLLLMGYGHKTLTKALSLSLPPEALLHQLLIGGVGAGVLLILSYFFEDWFASFRALKAVVMHLLGPCPWPTLMVLALLTAVGEELLFRGALQPFSGLVLTSILFGLLHMGKDGMLSAWSLWAVLAGLLLGWMYQATGSLWPCLLTHFGVNAVSSLALRRAYLRWQRLSHAPSAALSGDEGPLP